MKKILIVRCTVPGDGYEKDDVYPVVGWDDGAQVLRTSESGDCETGIYHWFGCELRTPDFKEAPQFVPVVEVSYPRF